MDCEKCEPLLLDELYEELDEVTSAAVKRHVAGCARCASIFNGMRATRRLATVPMVDLPDGFEDRILAATRAAHKVVPITWKTRTSRALSLAGNWAMRPQTAMAAVFLLMIGTASFVIRSRAPDRQAEAVSVTVAGEPAAPAPVADHDSLDDKASAAAHGANAPTPVLPPPAATASPMGAVALAGKEEASGEGARDDKAKDTLAYGGNDVVDKKKSAAAAPVAKGDIGSNSNVGPATQSGPMQATDPSTGTSDAFAAGQAAFRARNYAEATRQFDQAAKTGDLNAELWAAKTVRTGNGCAAALPRFDAVTQKAGSTYVGNEAMLEAARCQIAMGQLDGARDKLNVLVNDPAHAAQARQAQNDLNQVATRRAQGGAGSGGAGAAAGAARQAAPAKAPAPTSKPAAVQSGY